jgi:hypothetical protein
MDVSFYTADEDFISERLMHTRFFVFAGLLYNVAFQVLISINPSTNA